MMPQSQFSLSWGAHKTNICSGLTSLQQNGEFVDMTLAADGHLVKVHQVMMALASPYIKELISTAQCPHPVIFLNKISYETLSAILEYIYTGEVLVAVENLTELFDTGKELHIKGLEDMNMNDSELKFLQQQVVCKVTEDKVSYDNSESFTREEAEELQEDYYYEITSPDGRYTIYGDTNNPIITKIENGDKTIEALQDNTLIEETPQTDDNEQIEEITPEDLNDTAEEVTKETMEVEVQPLDTEQKTILPKYTPSNNVWTKKTVATSNEASVMQYTVSNQGSLQMILNRFLYFLKHTKRDGARQWRCVDYLTGSRCPALLITRDDVVTKRISAHTHSFHDKKILKKVQAGAVYSALQVAIDEGKQKKVVKLDADPHT